MSALTFLDVAIGLIFVYLLLSLICSVLNEWFSAMLERRPKNLAFGIRNLLEQAASGPGALDAEGKDVCLPLTKVGPEFFIDASGRRIKLPVKRGQTEIVDKHGTYELQDGLRAAIAGEIVSETRIATAAGATVPVPVSDALGRVVVDSTGRTPVADEEFPGGQLRDAAGKPIKDPLRRKAPKEILDADGKPVLLPLKTIDGAPYTDAEGNVLYEDASGEKASLDVRRVTELKVKGSPSAIQLPVTDKAGHVVYNLNAERVNDVGAARLFTHPLVASMRQGEKFPSYLPAGVFGLALLDLIAPADPTQPRKTVREVRESVGRLPEPLKRSLLPLVDAAGDSVSDVRNKIEAWYNDSMDRLTGRYKRWNMVILAGIGLVVTVVLHADTFSICKTLWASPLLRQAAVDAATSYVRDHPRPKEPGAERDKSDAPAGGKAKSEAGGGTDPSKGKGAAAAGSSGQNRPATSPATQGASAAPAGVKGTPAPQDVTKDVQTIVDEVNKLRIVTTWEQALHEQRDIAAPLTCHEWWWSWISWWCLKVVGLLFTTAALALGAPFWFDTLNRFINVRSAIKTKDDTDNKAAEKKNPPPAGASGTGGAGLDA